MIITSLDNSALNDCLMKEEKHIADLRAGFRSLKFLPVPLCFSSNSINPKLILYAGHVEYRGGFFTGKLAYQDIEKIDTFIDEEWTYNIVISKSTGLKTFIGNFLKRSQLQEFLAIFERKGCPLTNKAKVELELLTE